MPKEKRHRNGRGNEPQVEPRRLPAVTQRGEEPDRRRQQLRIAVADRSAPAPARALPSAPTISDRPSHAAASTVSDAATANISAIRISSERNPSPSTSCAQADSIVISGNAELDIVAHAESAPRDLLSDGEVHVVVVRELLERQVPVDKREHAQRHGTGSQAIATAARPERGPRGRVERGHADPTPSRPRRVIPRRSSGLNSAAPVRAPAWRATSRCGASNWSVS